MTVREVYVTAAAFIGDREYDDFRRRLPRLYGVTPAPDKNYHA